MNNQTQKMQTPMEVSLEAPPQCRTGIRQDRLPLNCRLKITNKVLEFKKLFVFVEFDGLGFKSQNFEITSEQFEDGSCYSMDLLPPERLDGGEFTLCAEQSLQVKVIVKTDGEPIATDQTVVKLLPPAQLSADVASVYSIVFQQNQFPLISRLDLTNNSPDSFGLIKVVAKFDPPDFATTTWNIDELAAGQSVSLKERLLKLSAGVLDGLNEKRLIQLKLFVYTDELLVSEVTKEVELLPKNHWGGELHMPELLAAFITPNTHYCDALLKKASNLLAKDGHESKLDAYQSNTRERPYMIAAALWSVICNEGISYCVPPASFAKSGQKIRLGSDISNSLIATCLDTALLFAGCLEQAGLNSVIALTNGHAMVGVWLVDECFPLLTNDDPVDLRNRIALKDLILIETTLATSDQPIKFSQAIHEADKKISEQVENEFVYVLDVKQARSRKISPIDFGGKNAAGPVEKAERKEVGLPPPPVLPPVTPQNIDDEELSPSDRVDQWRRKLLDLSKKNKLLNIRQRSLGFRILCADLDLLEDELASGKTFNILSKERLTMDGRSNEQFTLQTGSNLEDEFVRDQLRRGSLIADSNERDLEKNLINLFRRAKSDLEEGGANTLFLAIGMLRWKEDSRSEQSYKAPLILLPVKLERTSARAKPKIRHLPDEDPVFNLTLIEFLQDSEIDLSVFQHELPKDASGVDVKGIWNTVRKKIKDTPGFEVTEELVLSNFSFAKYLMWKDLSDRIDDLKQSPFVNHLVENPTEPYPHKADFIDVQDVDERIKPEEFYSPLNADSSQMVAIDASAKGVDFVLEGPPGTGKSETIANIISHNIALGKKVLFVSEKMAALDVVYSRLKKVGLGHLCLELHSNKASKKSVLDQLNEAWQTRENSTRGEWEQKARQLGTLRKQLNIYVEELHKESPLGYSAWATIGKKVEGDTATRIDLGWPRDLATAPIQTERDVRRAKEIAKDLGLAFKDVAGNYSELFSIITTSNWTPVWQANLVDAANALKSKLLEFDRQISAVIETLGTTRLGGMTFNSTGCWTVVAQTCIAAVEQSHRFALAENAKEQLDNLAHLAELKREFDELISTIGLKIPPEKICDFPLRDWRERVSDNTTLPEQFFVNRSILSELETLGFNVAVSAGGHSKINELMSKCDCSLSADTMIGISLSDWIDLRDRVVEKNAFARFAAKRKITKEMRRSGLKKIKDLNELDVYAQLIETIVQTQRETLLQCLGQAEKISELALQLAGFFANYKGDGTLDKWSTAPEEILQRQEYGKTVRRNFMTAANQFAEPGAFMATARKKLIDEQDCLETSPVCKNAEKFQLCHGELFNSLAAFKRLAGESEFGDITFSELQDSLEEIISSAPNLNAWCHWVDAKNKAENVCLHGLVRGLENDLISWDETKEQFESAFCTWLAPLLIDASDILCRFSASKHDDLIQQFRKLDEEVANTTGQFIAAKLASDMPDTTGPNAPHEYGVLSRELQRQRGHKPVRQLVQELGGYLLDLTPCFMMSPLSVAQYLPSDYQAFDLVVFDEASQITVWDAVGAIARGKHVIVVGDPKQMPPSNFFNRSQDVDDSDEADLESILDQAMAARVAYHRLKGHYRSHHESLITFSNHQYYQNSLITFPCADTRESAVIWHRVDGIYSKGAARNNPIEARAVVDEVVRRLKDPQLNKQSIGIVTLNSEQQQLIENLLDDERRKDTLLERYFKEDFQEPVFVKNLETVQGDQRDVICLSLGYGPTELGAQTMSMNFGPLNRQGGERRLNVAITRASTEMLVFTSFDSSMIDLSRTSSQAVKDLKAYIDYAARGSVALAQRSDFVSDVDQFDSVFEEAVAIKLREKGWKIQTQIGVSKFRIDLGVLDPSLSGDFLAGIECDGASYHSSPSARDRDRVRHIILENLGWKLIRIWSTDFFINPGKVIDRVQGQLEELLESKREEQDQLENAPAFEEIDVPAEYHVKNKEKDGTGEVLEEPAAPATVEGEEIGAPVVSFRSVSTASDSLPEMEEYKNYNGESTQDPRNVDAQTVAQGLMGIVETEGPMLAKRAYDVYLRHCGIKRMGKDLKGMMNRALQHAINKKFIVKEDEWGLGGLLYSIIRLPGQVTPRLRELGGRTIDEIPPSEIKEASRLVPSNDYSANSEEHLREILNVYGLKRLTEHTRDKLRQAIFFEREKSSENS